MHEAIVRMGYWATVRVAKTRWRRLIVAPKVPRIDQPASDGRQAGSGDDADRPGNRVGSPPAADRDQLVFIGQAARLDAEAE
jgi:hypothetical protein